MKTMFTSATPVFKKYCMHFEVWTTCPTQQSIALSYAQMSQKMLAISTRSNSHH